MDNGQNIFEIVKRRDFVEDLTSDLKSMYGGINPLWAEACARTTFAIVLNKVKINSMGGPLYLNEFNICIGPPGTIKSRPMTGFCSDVIEKLDEVTKYKFKLPSKFTSASMTTHLSELRADSKGWPPKYLHNHGIIIRDEFTSLFKQARKADWAMDILEYLSELYDGEIQNKRTVEHGEEKSAHVFVNLLTATTYDFISKVDDDFFAQGTGTRFLYTVIKPEDINIKDMTFKWEQFKDNVEIDREELINKYVNWLRDIYKITELTNVRIPIDVFMLWKEYNDNIKQGWFNRMKADPLNWKYPYLNRLPEYVLKLTGLYAISRQIELIIKAHEKDRKDIIQNIRADTTDFYRASATVNKHMNSFNSLIEIRSTIASRIKLTSHVSLVDSLVETLKHMPERCSNYSQWFATQTVVDNDRTFNKYLMTAIQSGRVKMLNRNELTPEQIDKYKIKTSAKLYKFVK